jgi:hypothetical protein
MNKMTTEIRYKGMFFNFMREIKELKMYFSTDCSYAIIVNKDEEILFELRADCVQNVGFLEDES